MSRKKQAEAAKAAGQVRFKPTRPCPKHRHSEFYTSNVLCVECLAENRRKNYDPDKKSEYWASVKEKQNDRRRYLYWLNNAVKAAQGLIAAGHSKQKAVETVLERFDIKEADLLEHLK